LWKKRRERIRWRRVGFRSGEGLACEVNVKEVEGLEARVGAELVIVLRVRGRRGVVGLERWKLDRNGALNAPRAPDIVVRSISAKEGGG
jgi:hypothetical protein